MRRAILITILFCSTPFVFASGHDLLDEKACKETKEGIGYFLGVADYLFKENEHCSSSFLKRMNIVHSLF